MGQPVPTGTTRTKWDSYHLLGQLGLNRTASVSQDNLVPTKTTRTYWGKCGYQDAIGQLGLNGATSLHPGLSRQLGQPVPNRTTGAFGITETPRISTRISTGTPSLLGSPGTPGSPLGHLRSVGAPGSAPRPQGLVLGPIGSTGLLGSAPGHCHPGTTSNPMITPWDNRDLWDHQKCQDHPLTPKQLATPGSPHPPGISAGITHTQGYGTQAPLGQPAPQDHWDPQNHSAGSPGIHHTHGHCGTTGHSTPAHKHPKMAKSCSCPFQRLFSFSLGENSFPCEILPGLNFQLLYKPLQIDYYKEKADVHTLLSPALGLSRRYYSNKVNCKELKPSKQLGLINLPSISGENPQLRML